MRWRRQRAAREIIQLLESQARQGSFVRDLHQYPSCQAESYLITDLFFFLFFPPNIIANTEENTKLNKIKKKKSHISLVSPFTIQVSSHSNRQCSAVTHSSTNLIFFHSSSENDRTANCMFKAVDIAVTVCKLCQTNPVYLLGSCT